MILKWLNNNKLYDCTALLNLITNQRQHLKKTSNILI